MNVNVTYIDNFKPITNLHFLITNIQSTKIVDITGIEKIIIF